MSLNDVLTNDEHYQREWASLERGIIDALAEEEDHVLPVSYPITMIQIISLRGWFRCCLILFCIKTFCYLNGYFERK